MKPFKTYLGLGLVAGALVFTTSCQKSFEDAKEGREVSRLVGNPVVTCSGNAIVLQMRDGTADNFFYVGDRNNVPGRQTFSGGTFNAPFLYFNVSADGGVPFHNISGGRLGVARAGGEGPFDSAAIIVGETLSFKLSSDLSAFLMSGFEITMHGNNTLAGSVEIYNSGNLVHTFNYVGPAQAASTNFNVAFQTPNAANPTQTYFFDEVRFKVSAGRVFLRGPVTANTPPGSRLTRFFLSQVTNAVFMRNVAGGVKYLGLNNTYINQGLFPGGEQSVSGHEANRQYKSQLADGLAGSGAYDHINNNKWLKMTAGGPGMPTLNYNSFILGVGNRGLEAGESITIEPGTDFPSGYFGGFEFRSAVSSQITDPASRRLNWAAFDGATLVASGSTSGVDQDYTFINPGPRFNRVVISGVNAGPTFGTGIGRPGNQVISAYPFCQ